MNIFFQKEFQEKIVGDKISDATDKTSDEKKDYRKYTRDEKKKFVEKAVSKATDPKDFDGFKELLKRIQAVR